METKTSPTRVEIRWVNSTDLDLMLNFAGWHIGMEPAGKTPHLLLTDLTRNADGTSILKVDILGSGSLWLQWSVYDEGNYEVCEMVGDESVWKQLHLQPIENPRYRMQLVLDGGIVIVGTVETDSEGEMV